MPELPEVERARLLLATHAVGRKVVAVHTDEQGGGPRDGQFDDIIYSGCTGEQVGGTIAGHVLFAAHRKGKHMWLEFRSGKSRTNVAFHFGMSGNFAVKGVDSPGYRRKVGEGDKGEWPPRYCKFELVLADDTAVAFTCPRRIGRIRLLGAEPLQQSPLKELGFDPLTGMLPETEFVQALAQRRDAIKAALLDQGFSAGVGNWIADEVCFQARVHPAVPAREVHPDKLVGVHAALAAVIKMAVDANADHDKFPQSWMFHYRWSKGKAGAQYKDGRAIAFSKVGGRTTATVAHYQNVAESKRPGAVALDLVGDISVPSAAGGGEGEASVVEESEVAAATKRPARKKRVATNAPPKSARVGGAKAPKASAPRSSRASSKRKPGPDTHTTSADDSPPKRTRGGTRRKRGRAR